jgi:glycosyltransferase involved in cell wall biosynthesis
MRIVDPLLAASPAQKEQRQFEIAENPGSLKKIFVQANLRPYGASSHTVNLGEMFESLSTIDQQRLRLLGLVPDTGTSVQATPRDFQPYGADIFAEIASAQHESFEVIHAHDWMTFPAGAVLKNLTGKPLLLHVHSLEHDRSGAGANPQIEAIEQLGFQNADRILAVSHYTKKMIIERHGVDENKISVVHNGVYTRETRNFYRRHSSLPDKIVLFLGRVTYQKGPDYFVEAAAKALNQIPDALFVVAGSGDMLPRLKQRVEDLGIQEHFLFTGFLRGEEVERIFSIADLYVMPSVSEPFGISALEAISYQTPVIISKQSGVAEVLNHAFKVDFWDVDKMADLISSALAHSELREDMVNMAREEVRRIHWDAAALKVKDLYAAQTKIDN